MGNKKAEKKLGLLQRFVAVLGTGLITGAADDDPSPVATYSIAGAQLGGLCGLNDVTIQRFNDSTIQRFDDFDDLTSQRPEPLRPRCLRRYTSLPIAIAPGISSQPQCFQNSRPRGLSCATKMIAR